MVPSAPASGWVANWCKLVQTGPSWAVSGPGCPVWFCLSFPINVGIHQRFGSGANPAPRGLIPTSELLVLVWKSTEFLFLGVCAPSGVTQQCHPAVSPSSRGALVPTALVEPLSPCPWGALVWF